MKSSCLPHPMRISAHRLTSTLPFELPQPAQFTHTQIGYFFFHV